MAQAICGATDGPYSVGGECVMPAGHPHMDGIGSQWVSGPPARGDEDAGSVACCDWCEATVTLDHLGMVNHHQDPASGSDCSGSRGDDFHRHDSDEPNAPLREASQRRSEVLQGHVSDVAALVARMCQRDAGQPLMPWPEASQDLAFVAHVLDKLRAERDKQRVRKGASERREPILIDCAATDRFRDAVAAMRTEMFARHRPTTVDEYRAVEELVRAETVRMAGGTP